MNPIALNEEGVDQSTIDKEVEIAKDVKVKVVKSTLSNVVSKTEPAS